MAAILREYGASQLIVFPIVKRGVVDFAVSADWTPVAGDCKISKDEGADANTTNLPVAVATTTGKWSLTLTATEMQAARIHITIIDAPTKAVEDQSLLVESYGNTAAQHKANLNDSVRLGLTALPNFAAGATAGLACVVAQGGTAQAGGASTITLAAAAVATDDLYKGETVQITGGAGAGQARVITGYVGATRVATSLRAWATQPDNTSVYQVLGHVSPALNAALEVVSASVTGNVGGNVTGSVGSVTGAVGSVTGAVGSVTGSVGSVTGAVGSVTGNVGGNVTGSAGSVVGAVGSVASGGITAASFAANAIAAAAIATDAIGSAQLATTAATEIAGAVWDELRSAHVVAGSFGRSAQVIRDGTAQAGAGATITLDAGASALDNFYAALLVEIVAGTGVGQSRFISAYVGATKVATVQGNWLTAPDVTSVFVIYPFGAVVTVANVSGNVNGSVGSVAAGGIAAASFTAGAINAAAIATDAIGSAQIAATAAVEIGGAVWEELRSGHVVAGSFGGGVASVQGNVTGSVGSVTGAVGSVTGNVGGNVVGSAASVTAAVTVGTNNDKTGYSLSTLESLALHSGTAQAGAASTITLAAGASATTDLYKGLQLKVYGGTGAGQSRTITGYNGGTKVATVDRAWATNPDVTSTYAALALENAALDASLQVAALAVNGNVTGTVASVTGAVGSVTGAVGSVTGNVAGNVTGSVGSLAAQAQTDVKTQVVATLVTDTYAEPSAVPAATASLKDKLGWLAALSRNRITQTSTTETLRNSGDTATIAASTVSDDATTFVKGVWT